MIIIKAAKKRPSVSARAFIKISRAFKLPNIFNLFFLVITIVPVAVVAAIAVAVMMPVCITVFN